MSCGNINITQDTIAAVKFSYTDAGLVLVYNAVLNIIHIYLFLPLQLRPWSQQSRGRAWLTSLLLLWNSCSGFPPPVQCRPNQFHSRRLPWTTICSPDFFRSFKYATSYGAKDEAQMRSWNEAFSTKSESEPTSKTALIDLAPSQLFQFHGTQLPDLYWLRAQGQCHFCYICRTTHL